MNDYEKAQEIMKQKKHIEELEEQRRVAAQNREIDARNSMLKDGYVSRESAKLAAEQANREKENRMEQNEREISGLKESVNSITYKRLLEMYKKDSLFSRFSRKVKGESPDWEKISSYSPEVLDYLEDVREGRTYSQRKEYIRHQKTFKDMNKEIDGKKTSGMSNEFFQEKYFSQFLRKLMMSEPALLREIEAEKKKKEADIALYGRDITR